MSGLTKQDIQDSAIYDDLITSLTTLKVILEDIDTLSKVIDLEVNNKIKQLELLEEELRITILRNRFFGRPGNFVEEEIYNTEGFKGDVKWEVKGV